MPRLTGDRLAEETKRIRPSLPVILISGFNEALNKTSQLSNVDRFLMKPFKQSDLAQVVREVWDEPEKDA